MNTLATSIESIEELLAGSESAEPVAESRRLAEIARALHRGDPARALRVMRRVVDLARDIGDDAYLADQLTKLADCHRSVGEHGPALACLEEALKLADALPSTHIPFLYGSLGRVHHALGGYTEAQWWLRESMVAAERMGDISAQCSALLSLAELYRGAGDFREALGLQKRALEFAERLGDITLVAITHSNIGIIQALTGNHEDARRSFEHAKELNREGGYRSGEASALMNMGELSATLGDLDAALLHDRAALEIFREIDGRLGEIGCLENIGFIHARRGEHRTALEYYDESLALFDSALFDPVKRGMILVAMAASLMATGARDRAELCGEEALAIALKQEHKILECRAYETLATIHEAKGDLASALDCQKRFIALKLLSTGEEARSAAITIQARIDMERAEKEREIYRMESERLELELAHKNRELAALALDLAQKTEIVRRLEKTMSPFASAPGSDAAELVEQLLPQVRELVSGRAQWSVFERQFQEVHPGFVKALLERCPVLTPTEVRVCTLMRIELSNKELADILRSSIRTVENHRRHIRRKLGLGRDANLSTLLAALG